ncbi:hypothetical protein FISHEDRAFT_76338 [Fistulina hepatica ATCC 64428]|uniref:Uncharacterized protein n=1 Tax=Fistulina hepatica ATCC 64428 TaxID=1128425 RepID=A0A0D7A603_9AGAR|nr:hypothetical protein FISHEDRAFT_76338 [Fistulina hepatica ATCC 64428]
MSAQDSAGQQATSSESAQGPQATSLHQQTTSSSERDVASSRSRSTTTFHQTNGQYNGADGGASHEDVKTESDPDSDVVLFTSLTETSSMAYNSVSASDKGKAVCRDPSELEDHNFTNLPLLPEIKGPTILQVFTHKSLQVPSGSTPEPQWDNQRLTELGCKAFDVAVTSFLFDKRPMLGGDDLIVERAKLFSDAEIHQLVSAYGLRNKIRCDSTVLDTLNSYEESRAIFFAYIGALFIEGSLDGIQSWISKLLTPESAEQSSKRKVSNVQVPRMRAESIPPRKKLRVDPSRALGYSQSQPNMSSSSIYTPPSLSNGLYGGSAAFQPSAQRTMPSTSTSQTYNANQNYHALQAVPYMSGTWMPPQPPSSGVPSQPHTMPPQLPPGPPRQVPFLSNPMTPAQPGLAFLPLFNQNAAKRNVRVDYNATSIGPSHALIWSVECVVSGIVKGRGQGTTKQAAKEEAAREAFYAMGWT